MKSEFTIQSLKRSKCAKLNKHLFANKKNKYKGDKELILHHKKRNEYLDWIGWNLLYWCNKNSVLLEEEYKFHPERNWRFDWAIPALKIAIEYEGGIFMQKSGHTSAKGMTKDTDKYNAAQMFGWVVLRFTALNYKDLICVLDKYAKQ